MKEVLAVDRSTQGTDVHQVNDRRLMDAVCGRLEQEGFSVERIDETALPTRRDDLPRRIISMAQAPKNTAHLANLESDGHVVVNSFTGILQTYRSFLTIAMAKRPQLPFAPGAVMTSLDPAEIDDHLAGLYERFAGHLGLPFWMKRGDVHAAHDNDVVAARSADDFVAAVHEMRSRGVETAVVQKHIDGPVFKFYGVAGGRFFHLQEFETGRSVDAGDIVLESLAMNMADYLDLTIFGGDAVRTPDGWIVIDLNAWPSFGTVRDEATPAIVDAILERFAGLEE